MSALHVNTLGQGEPVLLIHGLGHRHQVWRAVSERLVPEGLKVISIDLPGHGLSSRSWRPLSYSIDTTVRGIARTMKKMGVEQPHVVGNSLGGLIALEFAARGHGRSVVAAGFSPPTHLLKAGTALLRNRVNFARSPFTTPISDHAERPRRHQDPATPQTFARRLGSLHSWAGFVGYLPHAFHARFRSTLAVPATIAWGDHDVILDSAGLKRASARMPEVTWVEIADCGHFPMTDAPDTTAQLVLQTIRRAGC